MGAVAYFLVFARWPATRDFPWVDLLVMSMGVGLSAGGLRRAWPAGGWRRAAGLLGLTVSLALTALFAWYCFSYSAVLPAAADAPAPGDPIPAVVLADQFGDPVNLAEAGSDLLVLVFYRGFW